MMEPALDLGAPSPIALLVDDLAATMSFLLERFRCDLDRALTGEVPNRDRRFALDAAGDVHLREGELIETVAGTL